MAVVSRSPSHGHARLIEDMYSDLIPCRATPNETANLLKRVPSQSNDLSTIRGPLDKPERVARSPETVNSAESRDEINNESDSENEPGEEPKPRKISERRRIQNAKFTSWLVEAVVLAFGRYSIKIL